MAEAVEARLRALEDRAAIADLIASYGPLADSGDRWELVRTPHGWRISRRDNALLDGREAAQALFAR